MTMYTGVYFFPWTQCDTHTDELIAILATPYYVVGAENEVKVVL